MTSIVDDDLAQHLRKRGVPLTRENYILWAWGSEPPTPWTLENELELPDELQDWSWIREEYPDFFRSQPAQNVNSPARQGPQRS